MTNHYGVNETDRAQLVGAYIAGLEKAAEDAGIEKEALFGGALGKGLGWLGSKFMSATQGVRGLYGGLESTVAKPFSWLGQAVNKGLQRAVSPETYGRMQPWMNAAFSGAPKQMAQFGLFSGGINALMAEPGERGSAFMSGFGTGALGGLGWQAGQGLLQKGLGSALGKANWYGKMRQIPGSDPASIQQMVEKGVPIAAGLGLGTKGLIKGLRGVRKAAPFAGGWVASDMAMGLGGEGDGTGDGSAESAPSQGAWTNSKDQTW
jgi:hypothetical protein